MGPRRVICCICGFRLYYGGVHWVWRLWGFMREGRWFVGVGFNRDIEIILPDPKERNDY